MRIGLEVCAVTEQRTGVGHYVAATVAALLAHHEHEYLLYADRPLRPELGTLPAPIVPRHSPAGRWIWMQTTLPRALRRSRPDVCHFTNALAPLRPAVPYAMTIHDVWPILHPRGHPLGRRAWWRAAVPRLAGLAGAVLTPSEASRADVLRTLPVQPGRVHVVPAAPAPGLARVRDEAQLAAVRERYRLPRAFVVHVGALEPRKNLPRLLAAMRRVRRLGHAHRLVLVGPRGRAPRSLVAVIEQARRAGEVQVCGYVPARDLAAILTLATALAYPSLHEGFGLPPLEAMACGTPVVASDRGAVREVCGDAALLVDPDDEAALARALAAVLSGQRLREDLARRGRERAASFSWARSAELTLAAYAAALEVSS